MLYKIKTKAYFEEIDVHLKKLLRDTKKSVKICVAWINGDIYSTILNELANRGVKIEII